jgi:hypothetical protein
MVLKIKAIPVVSFSAINVIVHIHPWPRVPRDFCLRLANSGTLKYNLQWLLGLTRGDARSYGSPIYPA